MADDSGGEEVGCCLDRICSRSLLDFHSASMFVVISACPLVRVEEQEESER